MHRATDHTPQELEFIKAYADLGDLAEACKASGLIASEGKNVLYRRDTEIILTDRIRHNMANLVPKAVKRLTEGLERGATPDRGQLDAIKTVLDRTGHIAPKASEARNNNLEMQDMSESELRTIATQVIGEMTLRGAPHAPVQDGQVIDMLD